MTQNSEVCVALRRTRQTIVRRRVDRSRADSSSKQTSSRGPPRTISASELLTFRHLLDQLDNAPAQFGILDLDERFGQRKAVGGGEEIRHIGR